MNEAIARLDSPPAANRRDTAYQRATPESQGARPSLTEPLPSDVFTTSGGFLSGYRGYPAFSAPWFWRRTAIFGAAAAAIGLAQATIVSLQLHDAWLALITPAVFVPIWVAFVTAGPGFATIVRHRRLSPQTERAAVVIAILAGLAVSCSGQHAAEVFMRTVVAPRYIAEFGRPLVQPLQRPDTALIATVRTIQAMIFLCLGGGLALRTFFREQRLWSEAQHARQMAALRRAKSEADLRLTVLQAQVEPHFLFNTLASIHSLIRKDPDRAEATMEALVKHLRATMPRFRAEVGSAQSTLDQQIDICESYLALMQVRMGGRLRYAIDVAANLRHHSFPPLMLISLVENAIKHGIEPSASGGNVTVSAEIEPHGGGPQLAVSVTDDGVGLRTGLGGGMGLRNIREQLAAQFAGQGALLVRGRTVGGVAATIRVPYTEGPS